MKIFGTWKTCSISLRTLHDNHVQKFTSFYPLSSLYSAVCNKEMRLAIFHLRVRSFYMRFVTQLWWMAGHLRPGYARVHGLELSFPSNFAWRYRPILCLAINSNAYGFLFHPAIIFNIPVFATFYFVSPLSVNVYKFVSPCFSAQERKAHAHYFGQMLSVHP